MTKLIIDFPFMLGLIFGAASYVSHKSLGDAEIAKALISAALGLFCGLVAADLVWGK